MRCRVEGELKTYNLVIKVMPTGDTERYSAKLKFRKLLKFSKEVQVYLDIGGPIQRLCEEFCLVSPLAKVYMGQIDALNDCLVLDNVHRTGYVKLEPTTSLLSTKQLKVSCLICEAQLQTKAEWFF